MFYFFNSVHEISRLCNHNFLNSLIFPTTGILKKSASVHEKKKKIYLQHSQIILTIILIIWLVMENIIFNLKSTQKEAFLLFLYIFLIRCYIVCLNFNLSLIILCFCHCFYYYYYYLLALVYSVWVILV